MATRGRPPGLPKSGGRVRGSLDKAERALVTSEMAADILKVYKKLGGAKWLLEFAKDQPGPFIQQCLSRLFPTAQRDDPDFVQNNNTQLNFDSNPLEVARTIAFALNSGLHYQRELETAKAELLGTVEPSPQQACRVPDRDTLPNRGPVLKLQPEVPDADYKQWIEGLPLTDEERRDNALVRQTKSASLEAYAGSGAEHVSGARRPGKERSIVVNGRKFKNPRYRELL